MKLAYKIGLLAGAALLLFLLPERVRSEQVQRFGDYLVHYNALSSDMLPAQVAAQYGIADMDWIDITSHNGTITAQVSFASNVQPDTVWTWDAIGKRKPSGESPGVRNRLPRRSFQRSERQRESLGASAFQRWIGSTKPFGVVRP